MFRHEDDKISDLRKIFLEFVQKFLILVFIVHGVAHLVGTFIYWKIMSRTSEGLLRQKLFLSKIEIGSSGGSMLGLIYLVLAILFIVTGIFLLLGKMSYDNNLIIVLLLLSLLITFIDLLPTIFGFLLNVFYLMIFLLNKRIRIL